MSILDDVRAALKERDDVYRAAHKNALDDEIAMILAGENRGVADREGGVT